MADIALFWNEDAQVADVTISSGDLAGGSDLGTAVIISLFTSRRARKDDALPDFSGDRKGWFGDNFAEIPDDEIGSRLWLLSREKMTAETIARAQEYAVEALQWLIDDKVASRVDVVASRGAIDRLDLDVKIYRLDGTVRELRFADAWEALKNG